MKDFIFKSLVWLLTLPLLAGAIAFAVFHQQKVSVLLSPFGTSSEVPLYIPVLTAIAFGFLFGCLMTWAAAGRQRAKLREQSRKIKALEKELEQKSASTYKYHNIVNTPSLLLERKSS